jgi:hypothetical protein
MCLHNDQLVADLEADLRTKADDIVQNWLGSGGVAATYLAQHGDDAKIAADLVAAFNSACPPFIGRGEDCAFLALPPGIASDKIRSLAAEAIRDIELGCVEDAADFVLHREQPDVDLTQIPYFAPAVVDAYRQLADQRHATPHSRTDIHDWRAIIR